MLKRTTVLLLVLALAVSLCACSSTRENAEGQSSVEGSSTVDAAGAPSATEACTQYLEAVAAGNWERFTEVTGDKPTADELIDIRESLFDTTRPSTILKIFRLDVVRESGPTSVYEPLVVQRYGLGLRGLTIGVRRTRNGGWAVVSASPREVGKTEIAELKDELDAIPYAKPVIYLYPERPTDVEIRLDVDGTMQRSVPPYDERTHGWSVMADPSGRLTEADGRVYPYLFWEAEGSLPVPDDGFVVASGDVDAFLGRKLAFLGLSDTEAAAFIEYWSLRMKEHPYCFVRFAGPEYERAVRLSVSPEPDTVIRVFMVFRPLESPVSVCEQVLQAAPAREGFVVVEWGGAELDAKR